MAEKKGQHLVPACYLSSFVADISEIVKQNPKLEAGVYVNSNTLDSGWKMRGVNHKVFKKSYYYNLAEDNPNEPYIENFLSGVERLYKKNLQKVITRDFDNEVMSFLSYFTTLQYIRVDKFIASMQKSWDKVAEWSDEFSGGNEYTLLLADIVKKQIPTTDLGGMIHSNACIIYNNTEFPFLTSDSPVVRKKFNLSDLKLIIPQAKLDLSIPDSHESAFFFFPLTPSIAYVSCDLIKSGRMLDFNESELAHIFYLNYYSILNANENVYSSVIEPMKAEEDLSLHLKTKQNGQIIQIYTNNHRLRLKGQVVSSNGNNLSFLCEPNSELTKLCSGDKVSLAEVYDNGTSIIGMRYCSVKKIEVKTGLIVLESDIQLHI
ncbi:DUF4238 domain-containing protein [Vibrio alfacsensis]|uniref:DUF4238 domain-containing protein n=1 Tax=Vibrio alfacsensis TaxID=1074311 RepID=UPI002ADDCCCD|nr:DUF4238 domain-containing protein [Vibrio alfacsensis]WQE77265.1 DUF4238 domain-containing protein [Vibrio alfacsensis]